MDPCQGFFRFREGTSSQGELQSPLSVALPLHSRGAASEKPQSRQGETAATNEIDALMANAMTALSMKERESAQNDLHGIGTDLEVNDPQVLPRCLDALDKAITTMKVGTAYEEAEQLSREYVESEKLRRMFVRSERYDGQAAAERMIRFFELKRELFGNDKLTKDIGLEDLSEDDMVCLKTGQLQLCPGLDSGGRIILMTLLSLRKYKSKENLLRSSFYIYMAAMETEQAQKRGVISIHWTLGSEVIAVRHNKIRQAMPVHFAGFHVCYSEAPILNAATLIVSGMTKFTRVRFRSHSGNHLECLYALQGYGIPQHSLPIASNGELLTNHHIFWVERRQSAERIKKLAQSDPHVPRLVSNSSFMDSDHQQVFSSLKNLIPETSMEPRSSEALPLLSSLSMRKVQATDNDVLLTRGRPKADHVGSAHFRNFIDECLPQFEKGTKSERLALAETVIETIKASGGRFLKRESEHGQWENIGYGAMTRKRVLMTFRNRKKALGSAGRNRSVNPSKGEDR